MGHQEVNELLKITLNNNAWDTSLLREDHRGTFAFSVRAPFNPGNDLALQHVSLVPPNHLITLTTLQMILAFDNEGAIKPLDEYIRKGGLQFCGIFGNRNTTSDPKRIKLSRVEEQVLIVGGLVDIPNIWGKALKVGTKLYIGIGDTDAATMPHVTFNTGQTKLSGNAQRQLVPSTDESARNSFYVGRVYRSAPASYATSGDPSIALQNTFLKDIVTDPDRLERLSKVTVLLDPLNLPDIKKADGDLKLIPAPLVPPEINASLLDIHSDESIERYVTEVMAKRGTTTDAQPSLVNAPDVVHYLKTTVRQEGVEKHQQLIDGDLEQAFDASLDIPAVDYLIGRYRSKQPTEEGWSKIREEKLRFLPRFKRFIHRDDWKGFARSPLLEEHIQSLLSLTKQHGIGSLKSLHSDYTVASIQKLEGPVAERFSRMINMEKSMQKIYSKS